MYYLAEVVTNRLEAVLGTSIVDVSPLSGGDINDARLVSTQDNRKYFVKVSNGDRALDMLRAEQQGLELLRSAAAPELYIPEILNCGATAGAAFLLMEYIPATTPVTGFWTAFGHGLARLHQPGVMAKFGLDHANFIGRLPQSNRWHEDWPAFYAAERLLPQGKLAYESRLLDLKDMQQLERLCRRLESFYPRESPALIHGDLWNGNYLVNPDGRAVLIDPAVAYSHREMDLAMSRLFGGFPPEFYNSYQESYPLETGWEERIPLGQLYYLLVHLNLFGNSYLPAVKRIISSF